MMSKFKFGDMVRHKKYGIGVISTVKDGNIDFYVSFKDDCRFDAWIHQDNLELVPHPDTIRLDWLMQNGGQLNRLNGKWCITHAVAGAPNMMAETSGYILRSVIDGSMQATRTVPLNP